MAYARATRLDAGLVGRMQGNVCAMRFLGVDLAWGENTQARRAADTGVAALAASGEIIDASWTCGIADTIEWIGANALDDTLVFVDASLVVDNQSGQRLCETRRVSGTPRSTGVPSRT